MSKPEEASNVPETVWLSHFLQMIPAGTLTVAIPAVQWLVSAVVPPTPYRGWISSFAILLCVYLAQRRKQTFSLLHVSPFWKRSVYLAGTIVLGLLAINLLNKPVAQITGQPRSPFEVVDVVIFVPIAEELIFRGILWSVLRKLCPSGSAITLAATSVLFGLEHLGYWAQAGLPLPPEAYLHALSMVAAGLCFGALRWTSRSLAVPAVVHMLANGAILLTQ